MIRFNAPFRWTDDEQIYTPEVGPNGETLYCQKKDFTMPNSTLKTVALNSPVDGSKVYRLWGIASTGTDGDCVTLPYVSNEYVGHYCLFQFFNNEFQIRTAVDWSGYPNATGYIIYRK